MIHSADSYQLILRNGIWIKVTGARDVPSLGIIYLNCKYPWIVFFPSWGLKQPRGRKHFGWGNGAGEVNPALAQCCSPDPHHYFSGTTPGHSALYVAWPFFWAKRLLCFFSSQLKFCAYPVKQTSHILQNSRYMPCIGCSQNDI